MKLEPDCFSKSKPADCKPISGGLRCQVMSWLSVLGWMVIIYLFSDQPHSGELTEQYLGGFNIAVRKLAHFTEYAILLILCRRAWILSFKTGSLSRWPGIAALLISFLYALSDEWHQSYVPGRSATISDAMVDTAGAATGLIFLLLLWRVRQSMEHQAGSGDSQLPRN